MILILECCGVHSSSDTYSGFDRYAYSYLFCCKNAHGSRMNSGSHYNSYSSNLDVFGGCGGYKTDTCSDTILFKTRMFFGWFLAIVLLQLFLENIGLIFVNKEYSQIRPSDVHENSSPRDTIKESHSMTIMFRTAFDGIKSFFISYWKRSKFSIVQFILLGISAVCNIGTLGLAIHIRYDSVFGNSDIQTLLSKFRIADHTFTRALNIFSIVVVTFSSTSIAVIIFAGVTMVSPKWKRILLFIGVGLWSIVTVANIVQIGLWGKFKACADTELEDLISTELINNTYTYRYSHASGYHYSETSLSWNTLFVKGCDTVIVNRLDLYSLLFFILMGTNVLTEIGMIAITIHNAVSLTKEENAVRVRYRSDEDNVELNEKMGKTTPKSVQR
ncbi:uncharacterized protein LOC127705130 isoform X2 [Mytilus californianus]|uniref:uncharacterized protein LOC127705130 isoform X2 n=1 Tax=Mytilus californianus TaxID=6549 RepID=UPI0022486CE9|nr:uncharacterized protein LOC127705130 isoform X2 [Mytilus californianus]